MSNLKLGFVVAMEDEVATQGWVDAHLMELVSKEQFAIYQLKIHPEQTSYLAFSGIGMIQSAACTQYLLDHFGLDQIVNLGSAGTTNPTCHPLELYQLDKVYYGDCDLTAFGYDMHQMARQPAYYVPDAQLQAKLIQVIQSISLRYRVQKGIGASINSFLNQANQSRFASLVQLNPHCVDMEVVGIAQVCALNHKPWASLKVISDSVIAPSLNADQFKTNLETIAHMLKDIIQAWH